MFYNGGVLSTAPCDPTWTGTKRPISEATQSPRNCFKEGELASVAQCMGCMLALLYSSRGALQGHTPPPHRFDIMRSLRDLTRCNNAVVATLIRIYVSGEVEPKYFSV